MSHSRYRLRRFIAALSDRMPHRASRPLLLPFRYDRGATRGTNTEGATPKNFASLGMSSSLTLRRPARTALIVGYDIPVAAATSARLTPFDSIRWASIRSAGLLGVGFRMDSYCSTSTTSTSSRSCSARDSRGRIINWSTVCNDFDMPARYESDEGHTLAVIADKLPRSSFTPHPLPRSTPASGSPARSSNRAEAEGRRAPDRCPWATRRPC